MILNLKVAGGAGLVNLLLCDNNLGEPAPTGIAQGLLILLLLSNNLGKAAFTGISVFCRGGFTSVYDSHPKYL